MGAYRPNHEAAKGVLAEQPVVTEHWDVIYTQWGSGVRARDWPAESVLAVVEEATGTWRESYARLLAYYHELDRRRLPAAVLHIAAAYREAGRWAWEDSTHSDVITFEYAFVHCLSGIDPEVARLIVDHSEIPQSGQTCFSWRRAAASVERRYGDRARADELIRSARNAITTRPHVRANEQAELDWLEWIREQV